MATNPSLILRSLTVLMLWAAPLPAQRVGVSVAASDSAHPAPPRKSPLAAGALGLVLPGAGHWYAGERGRGALVAAVYFAGFAVVSGGRTDRVGNIAGTAVVGALGVSIFDGAAAARRFNQRRAVPEAPAPREGPR